MAIIPKGRWRNALALILVMLVLSACSGGSASPTQTISNAELLKQAAANMKSAKSYHLELNSDSGGSNVAMSGDFDLAANNNTLSINMGGQQLNAVTIGTDVYVSSDGGKTFTNMGSGGSSITKALTQFTQVWQNFNPAEVDKAADTLKEASPRTETINGTTCLHLTTDTKNLPSISTINASGIEGTVDIWLALDAQSVCQLRLTGTLNGQQGNATIKWSKINTTFDIKAPSAKP